MGALPVGLPLLSTGASNKAMNSESLEHAFILSSIVFVAVLTSALYLDTSVAAAAPSSDFLVIYQSETVSRPLTD